MFFDLILLNRQHRGRFGLAWLAATRGVRHLTKRDVLEVDLTKLCDDIMEFVCSESDSPNARFSLRLSTLLVNGTLKIYRQKAVFLIDEVVKVLSTVSMPMLPLPQLERTGGVFESQPTPIPRKKGTKRRRSGEESTPQSEIEKFVAQLLGEEKGQVELALPSVEEELGVFQARADEITLRETQIQPRSQELIFEEDLGILGVAPTEVEGLRDVAHPAKELFPPLPGEEVQEPEMVPLVPHEEPPAPREKRRRRLSSSPPSEPETGPIVLTVQAMVHQSAGVEAEAEPRRRPSPVVIQPPEEIISEVQVPAEIAVPKRRSLKELQRDVVEERDAKIQPPKDRKKKKMDKNNILSIPKPTRFVTIERPETGDFEPPEPPFQTRKEFNLTKLLNLYVVIGEQGEIVRTATTPRDSTPLQKKSIGETPPAQISAIARTIPPILEEHFEQMTIVETPQQPMETALAPPQPILTSTPVVAKSSLLEIEQTIEQVMAVAAEDQLVSPRKRRRLIDVEPTVLKDLAYITLPSELQSRELTGSVLTLQQEAIESVVLPVTTVEGRHQDIVNKVLVSGRLTLEELCQQPVNRLHIARAFSDVLVLSRHGYVTLTSEETSTELKFVERGPKMK
ncbi:meiotic recombination protein REC8 homolog [Tribolium madens]|uniref:meiotic recombination protein REC8 homolog n=1 Tax=Tribolium madens TaxID=41895 RepID=UPI001CF7495B|nr:meiotic recombination protein REC8 homolog [Tribolium madens]